MLTLGNDMLMFAVHSDTHIDSMNMFVDDNHYEATIDGMLVCLLMIIVLFAV